MIVTGHHMLGAKIGESHELWAGGLLDKSFVAFGHTVCAGKACDT